MPEALVSVGLSTCAVLVSQPGCIRLHYMCSPVRMMRPSSDGCWMDIPPSLAVGDVEDDHRAKSIGLEPTTYGISRFGCYQLTYLETLVAVLLGH